MAWYSTGTVAVTNGSATVTGTGTAWFGALQQGWGMVGPDGRAYEIDTVDSATKVTLRNNYQGSTASAQGYSMFPTMSLANEIVDRLNTLIGNFQGTVDGAGAGKFQYGTEAEPGVRFEGDPDTGMRRSAANEVALVAGGTDQLKLSGGKASGAAVQSSPTDTAAGKLMRADYGYSRGNVLGTVTQTAGTPTGAIIERGSNPNGQFVRFADGTQICWLSLSSSTSDATDWNFPAAFASSNIVVSGTPALGGRLGGISLSLLSANKTAFSVYISSDNRVSTFTRLMAIGRWF